MLILIIITILLVAYYYISVGNREGFANQVTYYKCSKRRIGGLYKDVFKLLNLKRVTKPESCDIYLPCGYNYVENELKNLSVYNDAQQIYGINGCDNIVSKNGLWNILEKQYGRKMASTLMPESYILYKKSDMKLLKNNFDKNNIYLLKKIFSEN